LIKREQGTGNRKLGIGNRELRIREQGIGDLKPVRTYAKPL